MNAVERLLKKLFKTPKNNQKQVIKSTKKNII